MVGERGVAGSGAGITWRGRPSLARRCFSTDGIGVITIGPESEAAADAGIPAASSRRRSTSSRMASMLW